LEIRAGELESGGKECANAQFLGRLQDLWLQLFYPVVKDPLMWERTDATERSLFVAVVVGGDNL